MKDMTIMDTTDEIFYEDYDGVEYEIAVDDANFDLMTLIKNYENRYHTDVQGILLTGSRSSRYGAISGNGARGGWYVDLTKLTTIGYDNKKSYYLANRPYQAIVDTVSGDDLEITIKDNRLYVSTFDHDGSNSTVATFVTFSDLEKLDNLDYLSTQDIDNKIHAYKKPTRV